jgi:large subunit ribosomal protein L25
MSELTIEVEAREERGKNANRRLRAQGLVPAVVYGGGREPVPIQIPKRQLLDLMRTGGGEHAVFLLQLAGSGAKRHTMIRDMQVDPVTRAVIHIDFQRIEMSEVVRVDVPVELTGVALGVKNEGGMLDFVTRAVAVECLPAEIPGHLTLDVSELHVGQHVEARELALPAGVKLAADPLRVIVSVAHSRVAEAPAAGEEEGLIEAEKEEPEVIGRGKEEGAAEGS